MAEIMSRGTALLPSLFLSVSLSVPLAALETSAAAGAVPREVFAEATTEDEAGPEEKASASATASGEAVVVDELTSEVQEVIAQPDGSFTASFAPAPVRTQVDGDWSDIDPTLTTTAGGLVPNAVYGDVVLSDGGPAGSVLGSYELDGVGYEVRTPFPLAEPVVDGATAIYRDTLPGVDLVASATNQGFTYDWVIKTPAAAEDERLREITMPVELDGLVSKSERGGTTFVDEEGVPTVWMPTPTMWDSGGQQHDDLDSGDGSSDASAAAAEAGPSAGDQISTIGVESSQVEMTLEPDMALLTGADTTYPVVIDPAIIYNPIRNGWTAVWDNFPSKSFWQTDHSLGAGYEGWQQNKIVRSYFRFNTTRLAGKYIINAEFNVRQIHAASCSARATDVYRTGAIGTTTTWNRQPRRYELQDSNSSTVGCGSGTGMVGWNVSVGVKNLAASSAPTGTFMVRGRSESDRIGWKQFDDAGAELAVRYVSRPNNPTSQYFETGGRQYQCGTAGSPTVIGDDQVKLSARLTSADGASATMRGVFRLDDPGTTTAPVERVTTTNVASGSRAYWSWPLANGHTYRFAVKGRVLFSGGPGQLDSGYTEWCYLRSDTTRPPPPAVSSSTFSECATPDEPETCSTQGTRHTPGTFVVDSPSTDAVAYLWSLNKSEPVRVAADGGAARSITVRPELISNTFTVYSVDAANNPSVEVTYIFQVAPKSPSTRWSFDDAAAAGRDTGTASDPPADSSDTTTSWLSPAGSDVQEPRGRVGSAVRPSGQPLNAVLGTTSTTSDLTVTAWVRVDAARSATFVAAGSSTVNAFELGYDANNQTWFAGRRTTSWVHRASASQAVPAVWTHLAAVQDVSAGTMTLFVNGRRISSVTMTNTTAASTQWRVGCGFLADVTSQCVQGAIDEVQIWSNAALTADEVAPLANPIDPASRAPLNAVSADWGMSELGVSSVADSHYGRALSLTEATVVNAADGSNVLFFPGTSTQSARSTAPPVDTHGSFAVSMRVQLARIDQSMVLAQQNGAARPAWTLAYRANDPSTGGGKWIFQRTSADSTGTVTTHEVRSFDDFSADEDWTSITAVYRSDVARLFLYINGRTFDAGPSPSTDATPEAAFTTPWTARSTMTVGNGYLNGSLAPAQGNIDRLELFVGAMDAQQVLTHHESQWS